MEEAANNRSRMAFCHPYQPLVHCLRYLLLVCYYSYLQSKPTRYLPYRSLEVGKGHRNIREAGIHGIFFFLQASHLTLVMHQHNRAAPTSLDSSSPLL